MSFLEHWISFLVGLALFALLWGARKRAAAQRSAPGSRELVDEVRAPLIIVGFFLLFWLWLFLRSAAETAQEVRVSAVLVHVSGGVAILRIADIALFATIRRMRGTAPPKIVRSLVLWILTATIVLAGARAAWQFDLGSLLTTSALLSVVLGFALQESLGNLFAGLTLNAEHPFEAGDYVSFGAYTGRVLDVGWRSTRLITGDEDELLVPNGFISREVVVNRSRPSPRRVVELQLTLDSQASPAEVKRVLLATARSCDGVLALPEPAVQLVRFADNGVLWKLRFHTPDFASNDDARDQVQQALWYALRRAAIDMPYPQLALSRRERPEEAAARRGREHLVEAEELLGRIDFLAALKPDARIELARHARYLEYGAGEAVVRQGEVGDAFYLVAHGQLSVRIAGHEKEVARLSRGAFFGEVALLTGEPRTATVVAVEDAALLAVDREAFARLFASDEGIMEELARVIAGRKAQLASASGQRKDAPSAEEQTMLTRIRGIFDRHLRL